MEVSQQLTEAAKCLSKINASKLKGADKMTNRDKILRYLQQVGHITKSRAASMYLSYGLGDVIMHLRLKHIIITTMCKNSNTGRRYAVYEYLGKIKQA